MFWQNPNMVVLGGNLTHDPVIKEVGKAPALSKVVEFSIGNNLKSSGQHAVSKPNFFRCEAWGKTAELIAELFKKGDAITITGALHWNSWQDSTTGEKREAVRIKVENFFFPGTSPQRKQTSQDAVPAAGFTSPRPPVPPKAPPYFVPDAEDDNVPM